MNLPDLFSNTPPRETAGSTAPDRFEYQKNWSLGLLLQLHLEGSDYLLVFDMHEDVVAFDAAVDPQKAKFYQVKTLHNQKQKTWTTAALIKQKEGKKGPKNSILGKLYGNKVKFSAHAEKLAVVSNAPFTVKLLTGKNASLAKKTITYLEIHPSDRAKIEKALKDELQLEGAPQLNDLLFLEVSDLSIEKHAQHTRGIVVDFLEQAAPQCATPAGTIYRVLIDEIRVRNDTTVDPNDFKELAKLKGISRLDFQKVLDRVTANPSKTWDKIESNMEASKVPLSAMLKTKIAFREVQTDRMTPMSATVSQLHSSVASVTHEEATKATTASTYELSEHVLKRMQEIGFDNMQFSDDYIRALAMTSFHETGNI